MQDKAAEQAAQAALLSAFRREGSLVRRQVSSFPSVFTVILRLRQACTHSSLLPPDLQLARPTGEHNSEEAQGSTWDLEGSQPGTEGNHDAPNGGTGDTVGRHNSTEGKAGEPEGKHGKARGKQPPPSLTTMLEGIQIKRGQSTKIKSVMHIIEVC